MSISRQVLHASFTWASHAVKWSEVKCNGVQFSISWRQTTEKSFTSILETDEKLKSVLGTDIPVALATEKETEVCNVVIGNSVSLVDITESDQINKDAKFLDEIKFFFDGHEISAQFTTARNQLENACRSARNSLKKRRRNTKNEAWDLKLYPYKCISLEKTCEP